MTNAFGILTPKHKNRFNIHFESALLTEEETLVLTKQSLSFKCDERWIRDFINDETRVEDLLDITFEDDVENNALKAAYKIFNGAETVTVRVEQLNTNDAIVCTWLFADATFHRLDVDTLEYTSAESAKFKLTLIVSDNWSISFSE